MNGLYHSDCSFLIVIGMAHSDKINAQTIMLNICILKVLPPHPHSPPKNNKRERERGGEKRRGRETYFLVLVDQSLLNKLPKVGSLLLYDFKLNVSSYLETFLKREKYKN